MPIRRLSLTISAILASVLCLWLGLASAQQAAPAAEPAPAPVVIEAPKLPETTQALGAATPAAPAAAAAPKGLPADVRAKLEAAFAAAAKSPDVKARLEDLGYEVVANNGAEFTEFLAGEIARWKAVVDKGKITPVQ